MFLQQAQENLSEHKDYLSGKITSLKRLLAQLECVMAWVNEVKTRVNISKELTPAERTKILDNIMVKRYSVFQHTSDALKILLTEVDASLNILVYNLLSMIRTDIIVIFRLAFMIVKPR